MSASATMVKHRPNAERSSGVSGLGDRRRVGIWRTLRGVMLRADPAAVVLLGFTAAIGWAFGGSLLLGLGTGSTSRAAAWLWLGGELLIGAAVFLALTAGVPPGRDGA